MLKKISFFTIILLSSFGVAGCSMLKTSTQQDVSSTEQKTGNTQLTGTIFVQSNRVYLKNIAEKPQDTLEIDSYSIDLQSFSGKHVQVTGQYSGDTLFVAQVREIE